MDKYEFQIKTEQMGKLLKKGDYQTAAKIADSIDWRKVHYSLHGQWYMLRHSLVSILV